MSQTENTSAALSHRDAIYLWAIYFKRFGELLHDRVMEDVERCNSLDAFDQAYLRAFWSNLISKLTKLQKDPLPVPAQTKEDLYQMWNTMALEFGLEPDVDALAPDVKRRLRFYKDKIAEEFEKSISRLVHQYEISSPIEQIFLIQWKYQRVEENHFLVLQPQSSVPTLRGQFSVDFLVTHRDGRPLRIAVELDGHDFHEKTRVQATRDKQRERALTGAGLFILRFTGSEVFNNSRAVINEIIQFFSRK